MYKKILVPLDGSARAEKILPHIEILAKCMQSEVILMRVYRLDFSQVEMVGYDPHFYETIEENFRRTIFDYLTQVQKRLQKEGIKTICVAEEGDVVSAILNIAEREEADLVAMSSHGRTGFARVFYGSVAAGVLHGIDRPLLLIRADEK